MPTPRKQICPSRRSWVSCFVNGVVQTDAYVNSRQNQKNKTPNFKRLHGFPLVWSGARDSNPEPPSGKDGLYQLELAPQMVCPEGLEPSLWG